MTQGSIPCSLLLSCYIKCEITNLYILGCFTNSICKRTKQKRKKVNRNSHILSFNKQYFDPFTLQHNFILRGTFNPTLKLFVFVVSTISLYFLYKLNLYILNDLFFWDTWDEITPIFADKQIYNPDLNTLNSSLTHFTSTKINFIKYLLNE